jgi:hypothetical protein
MYGQVWIKTRALKKIRMDNYVFNAAKNQSQMIRAFVWWIPRPGRRTAIFDLQIAETT